MKTAKIGILMFLAIFAGGLFLSQPASAGSISACGNLDIENEVYTLISNVSSADYCFHIIANNIILDGNGYQINYSQVSAGNAVNNSGGYDNLTIKNNITIFIN